MSLSNAPLAPPPLRFPLLVSQFLVWEEVRVPEEHAHGLVAGYLHAVFGGSAALPQFISGAPPEVVEQPPDVLWVLAPSTTLRAAAFRIQERTDLSLFVPAVPAVEF